MKKHFIHIFSRLVLNIPALFKFLDSIHQQELRIIYYHMVSEKKHNYYFNDFIDPNTFKRQIKFVKNKYEIISLYEALDRAKQGSSLKNCMSITFDDGFSECFSIVAPILYDEKLTATFFLLENSIDNKNLMWKNKLLFIENSISSEKKGKILNKLERAQGIAITQKEESLLSACYKWDMSKKDRFADFLWDTADIEPLGSWLNNTKPYMTTDEIRYLTNNGFDVGSHTRTHPMCSKLDFEEYKDEVIGSLDGISRILGKEVDLFSYPFGDRANQEYEKKIIENSNIKCLLGIKGTGLGAITPYNWERDLLELNFDEGITRFLLRPTKRKFINK